MLEKILEQVIIGASLGMIYALIAVGYSLVFGVLRLVNFAHGSVYAFGAMATYTFVVFLNWGFFPSLLVGTLLTGLLTMLIDWTGLKPLRKKNASGIAALVTTIGLSYIIQTLLTIAFNSQLRNFPAIFDYGAFQFGKIAISSQQIMVAVISLIMLLVLSLLVNKTKVGLAMRAVEQNPTAALINGININFVIAFTFFLCGTTAAIAGSLVAGYYKIVYPTMGVATGLKTFAAAVVGGIGSLPGSVIGGLVIGITECLTAYFIAGSFRDASAYIILFLVLIVKPTGILGRKGISKV